ncbi:TIGR02611 family protein [Wenjunlia tyrosinilytica]|uniref:Membrane protein n=1 Tax=Wenjunlia tyrosinilytica TaxID=1544741 RepID=A0A918DUH7_9ACTN|nr:TIGR02611 family protein [Wenjunlia tyrosinilytica]GGO82529.1 membrane protein [Wenjunlia tyrosinilytica]
MPTDEVPAAGPEGESAEGGAGGGAEAGAPGHAEDEAAADAGERVFGSKAPMFIKRSRPLHVTWQVGVFLVGVAIIVAGMAMLVLPGPGWVAIFLGLAVLGTEFVWAQRALRWSKEQATKAAHKALDPRTRRRNLAFLVAGLLLAAGGIAIYIHERGVPW